MFSYIIRANGGKALAVHSDLMLQELRDLVRKQSKKVHPEGTDTIWMSGTREFINPEVMLVNDFANFAPTLIGIK